MLPFIVAAAAALAPAAFGHASSPMNDYNLSLDAEERVMVFARSEAEFRNARIYMAERTDKGWSEARPIEFTDQRYSDSDPWLTPDGRTLYFISDRPAADRGEGRSDYDIWRSTRSANGWSAPERLGSEVNSRGQELGPELHGGILYFSSARRGGFGGLDIYQARADGSGFEGATLLEAPFNAESSESDFTLSSDGRSAMFWRSVGERGMIHISYREGDGWGPPEVLPETINAGPFNFTPSFGRNGQIRFASTLERKGQAKGLADIYEAELPKR